MSKRNQRLGRVAHIREILSELELSKLHDPQNSQLNEYFEVFNVDENNESVDDLNALDRLISRDRLNLDNF